MEPGCVDLLEPRVVLIEPMIPENPNDLNSETFPDHLSVSEEWGKATRRALIIASAKPLPAKGVNGRISLAMKSTRPRITVISTVKKGILP